MSISEYPKVYNLGHKYLENLFAAPTTIEEKIDGSQFSFGVINGKLECRSHHQAIDIDDPGMFELAVETARRLAPILHPGWIYRCEFLSKPHHNVLTYSRVPKDNLILFDITTGLETYLSYEGKVYEALTIGLEVVPTFKVNDLTLETFKKLLETESCLGGTTIEGIVIKNYEFFGKDGKALMGKFVSEVFKEKHKIDSKVKGRGDVVAMLGEELKSEARWNKAIQHLREQGLIEDSPKDIGGILKEINEDVRKEEGLDIAAILLDFFWKDISRHITNGFPQWYKEQLAKKQFENKTDTGIDFNNVKCPSYDNPVKNLHLTIYPVTDPRDEKLKDEKEKKNE
jgi:hypothetical protein